MDEYQEALEIVHRCIFATQDGGDPLDEFWNELPKILAKDQAQTEKFLSALTDEELDCIASVFEDISEAIGTQSFVDFLKDLSSKHPDLNLDGDIQMAQAAIE